MKNHDIIEKDMEIRDIQTILETEILGENGIEAPTVHNGYTLWADLNEANPGCIYRIRIREEK